MSLTTCSGVCLARLTGYNIIVDVVNRNWLSWCEEPQQSRHVIYVMSGVALGDIKRSWILLLCIYNNVRLDKRDCAVKCPVLNRFGLWCNSSSISIRVSISSDLRLCNHVDCNFSSPVEFSARGVWALITTTFLHICETLCCTENLDNNYCIWLFLRGPTCLLTPWAIWWDSLISRSL